MAQGRQEGKGATASSSSRTTAGPRTLRGGDERDIISDLFSAPLGAINNPKRRRNAAGAGTSPATGGPGRDSGKAPPAPRRSRPGPGPPHRPPWAAEGSPSSHPGCGSGRSPRHERVPARHARGPDTGRARRGARPPRPCGHGRAACPTTQRPPPPRHPPGTQRSGRRRSPLARAPRGVQAAAAPGWRSAGIRRRRLLLPRRPEPPGPLRAGRGWREGGRGRWEPAERRFLLPAPGAAGAGGAEPAAKRRPVAAAASSAPAPGFPLRLAPAPRRLPSGSRGRPAIRPARARAPPAAGPRLGPRGPGEPRAGGTDPPGPSARCSPRAAPREPLVAHALRGEARLLFPAAVPLSRAGHGAGPPAGKRLPGRAGLCSACRAVQWGDWR